MFEGVKKFWDGLTTREKIALGVVTAGVVGYALYVRFKGNQQGTSSSIQPAVDLNGVPLNGTDLNGVFSTVPGQPGAPGTPAPTGTPTGSSSLFATIRAAGAVPGWDPKHTGVPVRSSPGGSIIGYAPFSGQVQLTGQSVIGPVNMQGGSNIWYPVTINGQQGYISGFDIGSFLGVPNRTVNVG